MLDKMLIVPLQPIRSNLRDKKIKHLLKDDPIVKLFRYFQ
jgi:hypothetical protein